VRLSIDPALLPLVPGVGSELALTSGEEYELLVAAPPALDAVAFASRFGLPLTRIGEVVAGPPGVVLRGGAPSVANAPGHDHFSG
jgi:thiamine monophosphate kinase